MAKNISFIKLLIREYKLVLGNIGTLLLLIIGPLIYGIYYPLPYEKEILRDSPVIVVDEDNTVLSRKLIAMLNDTENVMIAKRASNLTDAKQMLFERKGYAIFHIPKDFEKNISKNIQTKVNLYTDASYMIYYKQITTAAMQAVGTLSAGIKGKRLQAKGVPAKEVMALLFPVQVTSMPLYNPSGGYATYVTPAVFILIIQQTLLIGISLATINGRKDKDYLKKASLIKVLLSKIIAYLTFGIFQALYFFVIVFWIFKLPINSGVLNMAVILLPFILATIFLGITLSYFFKNEEDPLLFIVVTSLPLIFLSGITWSVSMMPKTIQVLRLLFPSSLGIDNVVKVHQIGASITDIKFGLINLLILTSVYLISAVYFTKKEMTREK